MIQFPGDEYGLSKIINVFGNKKSSKILQQILSLKKYTSFKKNEVLYSINVSYRQEETRSLNKNIDFMRQKYRIPDRSSSKLQTVISTTIKNRELDPKQQLKLVWI